MTKLFKYCNTDFKEKVISERIINRFREKRLRRENLILKSKDYWNIIGEEY